MLSNRLERLKEIYLESKPQVYAERALLVTGAYRDTEGAHPAVRRAEALDRILRQGSILIREGELIIGSKTLSPKGSPLYPEFNIRWIEDELDTLHLREETPFYISDQAKKQIKQEVLPYWQGKTVYDHIVEAAPAGCLEAMNEEGLLFHYYLNRSIGHITVNYEKVLQFGIKGIKTDVEKALGALEPDCWDYLEKKSFYEALLSTADSTIAFARRHADLAEKEAAECSDIKRKEELLEIARVCRTVPENPAASFHEALQSFWFTHLVLNLESNSYAISPGRFCQYLYPYLHEDLSEERITRDWARELLYTLWIKFNELTVVKEGGTAKGSNTYVDFQNLNIGGLTAEGRDGTNELSYMCLDALANLKLPQPQLSVLISRQCSQEFLLRAVEVIAMGTGMPAVFNEEGKIISLLDKGKSLVDARRGSINGCVEPAAQGCDHMASSGYVNLAKCLELALNSGRSMTTEKQYGTGRQYRFETMEDLWQAFEEQIRKAVTLKHAYDQVARAAFAEHCPVVFTSLVMDDCIEKGRDFHQGGARYNLPLMCGVGTGTVTDSLSAIETLVYKEKKIDFEQLLEALKADFNGYEAIRQMLLNKAPKYGNDIEETDLLAARLVRSFRSALSNLKNQEGVSYAANMIPTTTHIFFGDLTAATADGRKAGAPLSEGISPVQGMDRQGPTAVLKSITRIDHASCAGTLLNMKFTPAVLRGKENQKKFAAMIRSYLDLGGHHVQFNVINRKTLLEAQQDPEKYSSLLVRVAGYSDYFVTLSRDVQDEIISRAEHGA